MDQESRGSVVWSVLLHGRFSYGKLGWFLMAKNQKAKVKKGERNPDRKNGKAWKQKKTVKPAKKTWEQRCAERAAKRAGKSAA